MPLLTIQEAIKKMVDQVVTEMKQSNWTPSKTYISLGIGFLNVLGYTATAIDNVAQAIVYHADANGMK